MVRSRPDTPEPPSAVIEEAGGDSDDESAPRAGPSYFQAAIPEDDPPSYALAPHLALDWPDAETDDFPADVVAVPINNPLSLLLIVSKHRDQRSGKYGWQIRHPTKVELRNLEELLFEPEIVLEAIHERFSMLGTIHRLDPYWQDNFGMEGSFVISFAEPMAADAGCMLGAVIIERLLCPFSVKAVSYDISEVKLMRRAEHNRLLAERRVETLQRLSESKSKYRDQIAQETQSPGDTSTDWIAESIRAYQDKRA